MTVLLAGVAWLAIFALLVPLSHPRKSTSSLASRQHSPDARQLRGGKLLPVDRAIVEHTRSPFGRIFLVAQVLLAAAVAL